MNGHECENDKDSTLLTKKSDDDTMLPIKSGNKRYGDIVIWLWWTIVVPIHGKELWDLGIWHEAFPGALVAYLSLVAACGLAGMSVYTGKIFYSRLAFAANVWAMTAIHIFDWPFPRDCTSTTWIVSYIQWTLETALLSFPIDKQHLTKLLCIIRFPICYCILSFLSLRI